MPSFQFFKNALKSLSKSSNVAKKPDNTIITSAWYTHEAIQEFKHINPGIPYKVSQGPTLRPGCVTVVVEEDTMSQQDNAAVPKSKM